MLTDILATKPPKVGTVKFIAVDGRGGSGKSTLARLLSQKLGAEIIQTDDFAGHDNPLDWWPLVIERVFKPIEAGATTLSYPRSKWWPTHYPEPVVNQPVTPIMILEGVSSSRKEFRKYISLSVFVDTPKELCFERGVARDKAYGTGTNIEEITALWKGWQTDEDTYLARDKPEEYADIVLDGSTDFTDSIRKTTLSKS